VRCERGLSPCAIRLRSTRWRKQIELEPLAGPLERDKYDALFARPGSTFARRRIERLITRRARA
jgi:hypothetical protein